MREKDNLPFHEKYKKSKDPDRYMRMHETELILFDGARRKLKQMGITPKMSLLNQVNSDLEKLEKKRGELEKKCRSASREKRALEQKMENITTYLGIETGDKEKPEDSLPLREPVARKRDDME